MTARRPGDPALLVAGADKAEKILGWKPRRGIAQMIESAAQWHRGETYVRTILAKAGGN